MGEEYAINGKLKAMLKGLNPAEQKAARYIIDFPDDVIHHSISELSVLAGTSETTIFRLSKKLGFDGYQSLKIQLARELSLSTPVVYADKNELISELIGALNQQNQLLDDRQLDGISRLIVKANRLIFFGVASSGIVAEFGATLFMRAGFSTAYYTDPHLQIMTAVSLNERDIVFGISASGNIRDTVKSIEVATDSGAYTIAITGGVGSRIVNAAKETIYVAQGGHETGIPQLQPRVCQLVVIQLLLEKVIKMRDDTLKTLEKVDRTLDKKRYL